MSSNYNVYDWVFFVRQSANGSNYQIKENYRTITLTTTETLNISVFILMLFPDMSDFSVETNPHNNLTDFVSLVGFLIVLQVLCKSIYTSFYSV